MSRIWKQPVKIVSGVKIEIKNWNIKVSWSKWDLNLDFLTEFVSVKEEEWNVIVSTVSEDKKCSAFSWLTRSLISNMITWVSQWFKKELEIQWVWYRAAMKWAQLSLTLWFSHPVDLDIPQWLSVDLPKDRKNIIVVSWIDKQKVGQFASEIREYRKPEPYKWKWIRYFWEYVARKAWKTSAK